MSKIAHNVKVKKALQNFYASKVTQKWKSEACSIICNTFPSQNIQQEVFERWYICINFSINNSSFTLNKSTNKIQLFKPWTCASN